MNASDELQKACQEWRRLANAEGEAIRHGNWMKVADCQNAMQQLQPRISRWTDEARLEWVQSGVDFHAREKQLRAVMTELVEIEQRNNALLNAVRITAQAQLQQLNQSGHTLRQVQRSYSPAPPPIWSSFS